MKILIATGIYPPDIGGPATILKALAEALRARGFVIKIITYSDHKTSSTDEQDIYRIKRAGAGQGVFRWWQNLSSLVSYFLKMSFLARQVDLLYVTDTYSVGYFAYLLHKFLGKKYIIRFAGDSAWETATARGWTFDEITDFQDHKYNQTIEKLKIRRQKILKGARQVIAVSNFMSGLALKIGVSADKIKIIYNSIDFIKEEVINEEASRKIRQQFPSQEKIIITTCRLVPWKGVEALLKILPKIIKQVGPTRLLVLGSGPELNNLQNLASELKITDKVEFLGAIDHQQIVNYLAAADLFILNTHYEGLSHTLLEAMRAGVPIVSTNSGGNPEVITSGLDGWLVAYNDLEDLEKAAEEILTNHDLSEKFTQNARIKLKKFNWQKTVEETVDLFNKI
jgi:glycosyltransferase involved in cell wall biosynthesis